ncbi:MAG: hypothetical protein HN732_02235 [Rhodospirillaceae bacterium]|nr:hypothetical protein [Rhodospirillaceae bacterium]
MPQGFIDHIVIAPAEFDRAFKVFQAVCGGGHVDHQSADGSALLSRFYLGESVVELAKPLNEPSHGIGGIIHQRLKSKDQGMHLACIQPFNLDVAIASLEADGVKLIRNDGHVYVHPNFANGVLVQLTPRREFGERPESGDAKFDHLAILVADLEAACAGWEKITGGTAHIMGVHPVSNGAFRAARIAMGAQMGEQMLELISPVKDFPSQLAHRLADRGEGLAAVALPANDLEKTVARVKAIGARVLHQPPHQIVHPKDAAGLMLQLTPRVNH